MFPPASGRSHTDIMLTCNRPNKGSLAIELRFGVQIHANDVTEKRKYMDGRV